MLDYLMDEIIKSALKEDIGTGDVTTLCTVPASKIVSGRFTAKSAGVICGLSLVKRIFQIIDPSVELKIYSKDGDYVERGAVIAEIAGNARAILSGERVALNFLQHLSGIATKTRECVLAISGTKAVIADTRKTSPNLRVLEKYAVKTGGGSNHRFNLSDGILIKDNHIAAAGGIANAVNIARKSAPHTLKIEVEVENFEQLEQAIDCKADIIMLDNMTLEEMSRAVREINRRALVEASGNMGEKDLLEVAKTGVDIISIGALTHSVKAMDISLKFDF
jgi:nicotinate-nucleotide pyrophosphorylase (carboxylating)